MSSLYPMPIILPQRGKSDHMAVLCNPGPDYQQLGTTVEYRTTRVNGHNEHVLFASALQAVRLEAQYAMESCELQFNMFNGTIDDLINTFLPQKIESVAT